ncbi:unnamed protein product [Ixodes persulcatus]
MKGMTFSLLSGLLAALASLCGKFSMTGGETAYLCEISLRAFGGFFLIHVFYLVLLQVITGIRVIFFALMIACNAVMWTIFTKALRLCTTTLEATVTNTASNFFFTVGKLC